MTIVSAAGCLAAVLAILLILTAFGNKLLILAGLVGPEPLDTAFFSAGVGFTVLQCLLQIIGLAGLTRPRIIILLLLMAMVAGRGWNFLLRITGDIFSRAPELLASGTSRLLFICIALISILEAILSTAPLSGSDAMHYHFTAPLLELGKPQQPIFWLTHSFLTGLGHQLIAMGLALGSDRIALLLIFIGGAGTAAGLFLLARRWMPLEWSLATTCIFLATPMVFWQITTAGSPDIWMAFYILAALLAFEQALQCAKDRWLILAGAFAGSAASIKYTGWIVPAVVVGCLLFLRRPIRYTALCALAAAVCGGLPQLRNYVWTGDPFFPFLDKWIGNVPENSYGMRMLAADIHAHAFSLRPLDLLRFPAEMILHGSRYGLGQYFGPVVLAFCPLLYFCRWKRPAVWLAGTLWFAIFLGNALTTQMARFLLPAYPLALALVIAGTAEVIAQNRRLLRYACLLTLLVFMLFATMADVLYSKDFLPVALGMRTREAFLQRMAPDFQISEFVNTALHQREGKALVFFRHLYYLRVPYTDGDPASSWLADPNQLANAQMVLGFLHSQGIRWVVKTQSYPQEIAGAFEQCERQGDLIPEMSADIENLSGTSRTLGVRIPVHIVLLRVAK